MVQKIALEEHFLSPGLVDYWKPTMTEVAPAFVEQLYKRLTDFGDLRLATMDKAGIARSVLGVAGPGVQAERDVALATRKAREANDFLAVEIQKRPDRYAGFAHIAVQDPRAAADELERCMRDLKFSGAMINGHTNGMYLDDASLAPFWERADALGAVIYIHPTDPIVPAPVLNGVPALRRATWEWGFETGSHALRLVFSGVFDRYPNAKVALGHMGETLPYLLWRFDSRAKLYNVKLAKEPSDYIKDNIVVTVSGVYAREPLMCAVEALGRDKVMFAADYPFENAEEAGHFLDDVAIPEDLRADVAYNNAAKLLKL
ncbi:amidohydrolase [Pseudolabrys taiwanensis]|uniref:Amidohydrolase n=1 Tax=Pseudolabrys taiwanensis TaxID=331696 RepID=A0A345ZWJ3_9HYPH|nr:amidohydrolase family protein [Pseudolabrys taiwanensis]AXK81290.1 amidohydrolase [Pseudolabrys taiwanensis]